MFCSSPIYRNASCARDSDSVGGGDRMVVNVKNVDMVTVEQTVLGTRKNTRCALRWALN